jgi:hypothetical protein
MIVLRMPDQSSVVKQLLKVGTISNRTGLSPIEMGNLMDMHPWSEIASLAIPSAFRPAQPAESEFAFSGSR